MADGGAGPKLKKELSLFGVFAVAIGTTLSAGFFLLPGLAFKEAGPAVILSYLIAAAIMIAPTLCIIELATAMPKAGGTYFFLDRSLGPLWGDHRGPWYMACADVEISLCADRHGRIYLLVLPESSDRFGRNYSGDTPWIRKRLRCKGIDAVPRS